MPEAIAMKIWTHFQQLFSQLLLPVIQTYCSAVLLISLLIHTKVRFLFVSVTQILVKEK
jgi:hypothetical protein